MTPLWEYYVTECLERLILSQELRKNMLELSPPISGPTISYSGKIDPGGCALESVTKN